MPGPPRKSINTGACRGLPRGDARGAARGGVPYYAYGGSPEQNRQKGGDPHPRHLFLKGMDGGIGGAMDEALG